MNTLHHSLIRHPVQRALARGALIVTVCLLGGVLAACGPPAATPETAPSAPGDEGDAGARSEAKAEEAMPSADPTPESELFPAAPADEPADEDEWEPPEENPVMVPGFEVSYACVQEIWYEPLLTLGPVEGCNEWSVPITYSVLDDGTLVYQREGESLPSEMPMFHGDRVSMLGVLGVDTALLWVPDVTRSYLQTGYSVQMSSFANTIEDQEFVPAGSETVTVAGQTIDAAILTATFNNIQQDMAILEMSESKTWQVTITGWYDPVSGLALRVEWRRKLTACESPSADWQRITCMPMALEQDLVLVYELTGTTVALGSG